jgi:hypothetical protein
MGTVGPGGSSECRLAQVTKLAMTATANAMSVTATRKVSTDASYKVGRSLERLFFPHFVG